LTEDGYGDKINHFYKIHDSKLILNPTQKHVTDLMGLAGWRLRKLLEFIFWKH